MTVAASLKNNFTKSQATIPMAENLPCSQAESNGFWDSTNGPNDILMDISGDVLIWADL
jgi:hypothetical protein